jgi:hypothetical protein
VYFLQRLLDLLLAPLRALLRAPAQLFGTPKRLLGISLPARVAVLLAVFLILVAIAAFTAYLLTPDRPDFRVWFELWHILVILVLLVAIPVIAYFALRLWLEGGGSRFPDIDRAWREGIQELRRQGLDLSNIPLFLVIGAEGESQADRLTSAADQKWLVNGVPEGRTPLRWYANETAVLLVVTGAGRLSQVAHGGTAVSAPAETPAFNIRGTLEVASARGTYLPGSEPDRGISDVRDSGGGLPHHASYGSIRGTLLPSPRSSIVPGVSGDRSAGQHAPAVPRREAEEQTERLSYVCQLLQQGRQPLCPLNGILVLLPWKGIQAGASGKAFPESVRRDLTTVRESARLCCPVTVLVTGLENEPGFAELVRRVGIDRARANRFGRGFDLWTPPTAESLESLASHACGAFEDWVYDLFRQRDALGKPGNAKLYQLLCRVRSQIHAQLQNVLIHGLASDIGERKNERRPELFAGCYFAATGESSDRQSFVKSVMEKMIQLEEELEWTDEALRSDRWYSGLANSLLALNALFLLALIGMLTYRFMS